MVEGEVLAVRFACVPTQNLPGQSSVAFPVLEEYGFWRSSDEEIFYVGPTAELDIGNFSAQVQNSCGAHNSALTVRTKWTIPTETIRKHIRRPSCSHI